MTTTPSVTTTTPSETRSTRARWKIGAATLCAAAGMAVAVPAAAQAAGSSSAATAVSAAQQQVATPAAASVTWYYFDSYFWGSDCNKNGNAGIDNAGWVAYKCVGGWFEDYKLYYHF